MNELKFALAVFVKTPGLSPIKTRLAKDIGEERALNIYKKCLAIAEEKISHLAAHSSVTLVPIWAVAESNGVDDIHWERWRKIRQGDGDLGERLFKVYSELLNEFDGVLLMGADSPLFPESELLDGVSWLKHSEHGALIGPTIDGGYYVFGFRKPISKSTWTSVPYSSSNTLEAFLKLLPQDSPKKLLSEHWDIDTVSDLSRLLHEAPDFLEGI